MLSAQLLTADAKRRRTSAAERLEDPGNGRGGIQTATRCRCSKLHAELVATLRRKAPRRNRTEALEFRFAGLAAGRASRDRGRVFHCWAPKEAAACYGNVVRVCRVGDDDDNDDNDHEDEDDNDDDRADGNRVKNFQGSSSLGDVDREGKQTENP
ncbi:hypothetical protein PHSY_006269 [Pseudozyma hubeiensis SY62]|uniref:Uncharacterized protein n=1 Tax=Pseudozyma hubeiensis (strain SY62) TaxID=1305764 RepID=R9PKM9_PSEHS|nr:hypothetical protein PHSY_006269 [Pseudozyma hubeiensis SY62]GAC98675.1 hypothetical protein PHSY_006269 [Pseudozyma hubeiensis SY62]